MSTTADLDITINALNSAPRRAARALLAAGAPAAEVLTLVKEIHQLDQRVAAVRVDKDRAVRAASERALDCTEHGQMIRWAEEQAHRQGVSARQHEEARCALLSVLFALKEAVEVLRAKARQGVESPTTAELAEMIAGYLDKASKAHEAAWRRAESKGRKR